jgi:hypothetical protein
VWEALEEHEANETYDIKPREREKTNECIRKLTRVGDS